MLRAGAARRSTTPSPDVWRVAPGRLAGRDWDIEPDLSSAAPFLAAALVTGGEVTVPGWPRRPLSPATSCATCWTAMGARRSRSTTPA